MNLVSIFSIRRFRRPAVFAGLAVAWLLLACPSGLRAEPVSREYRLKAAFLCQFARFVEWPPERFADEDSALVIVVLGRNPFGGELARLVSQRGPDQRAIELRQLDSTEGLDDAHIVFMAAGEEARLRASGVILPGVLTVGESPGFAEDGGVIRFILVDEKVRFEINQGAGEVAGLRLSGQLLKLATRIRHEATEARP